MKDEQDRSEGKSKIRNARPDDPIFNFGYVIGGKLPIQSRKQTERTEAEELARLIQAAPVATDGQ